MASGIFETAPENVALLCSDLYHLHFIFLNIIGVDTFFHNSPSRSSLLLLGCFGHFLGIILSKVVVFNMTVLPWILN